MRSGSSHHAPSAAATVASVNSRKSRRPRRLHRAVRAEVLRTRAVEVRRARAEPAQTPAEKAHRARAQPRFRAAGRERLPAGAAASHSCESSRTRADHPVTMDRNVSHPSAATRIMCGRMNEAIPHIERKCTIRAPS